MRSIHGLYKTARDNDDDDTDLTTLETEVDSQGGALAGSASMVVINVSSTPTSIPAAGTIMFDTTLKCLIVSNATSFFTAEGSLAVV